MPSLRQLYLARLPCAMPWLFLQAEVHQLPLGLDKRRLQVLWIDLLLVRQWKMLHLFAQRLLHQRRLMRALLKSQPHPVRPVPPALLQRNTVCPLQACKNQRGVQQMLNQQLLLHSSFHLRNLRDGFLILVLATKLPWLRLLQWLLQARKLDHGSIRVRQIPLLQLHQSRLPILPQEQRISESLEPAMPQVRQLQELFGMRQVHRLLLQFPQWIMQQLFCCHQQDSLLAVPHSLVHWLQVRAL